MKQLTFTQDADNMWVAIAIVNGDFAIHLERETPGYVAVDLTTVENKAYQHAFGMTWEPIFDKDFHASVFPKYIRIKSSVEPTTDCYVIENS